MLTVVALVAITTAASLATTVEASAQTAVLDDCRVSAPFDFAHAGFPLNPNQVASTGTYRAAVLFVDFPDRPNTETTTQAFARAWTPETEAFIEDQSNGQIEIEVEPHHQWLRMGRAFAEYSLGAAGSDARSFMAEAIGLADPSFDFTGFDAVWLFYEKTAERNGGEAWFAGHPSQTVAAEGGAVQFWNGLVLGTFGFTNPTPELDGFDLFVAHETLHTFGLPDLYDWERTRQVLPPEAWRFVGNFDPMGSNGGFTGGSFQGQYSTLNASELFAWQRWQLGWLDSANLRCSGSGFPASETLTSLANPNGVKAIMVPMGPNEVLVVEARFAERYDRDIEQEGVLVYLVDSTVWSGDGPIQVQNSVSGDWASASDLLQAGESLDVDLFNVVVGERTAAGFDVQIISNQCDNKRITIDMTAGATGVGTPGDDVIRGTAGADLIEGLGGNDTICAGGGDDVVIAGDGDDVVFGEDGDDILRGNPGDDRLIGSSGDDRLLGGIGDDVISGGAGADYLGGFGGVDTIDGGAGPDVIFGGFGADVINGGLGADTIRGLIGNDTINGGPGPDQLDGDRGNDIIDGGSGNDVIQGGNANDVLFGGDGDDSVNGGRADDQLSGGPGFDTCSGNKQNVADIADASCDLTFGVP
jgi:M6 family metalloprotease-like protein